MLRSRRPRSGGVPLLHKPSHLQQGCKTARVFAGEQVRMALANDHMVLTNSAFLDVFLLEKIMCQAT